MRWDESKILFKELDWRRRNIVELLCMASENELLSCPSEKVHPIYQKIIESELEQLRDKA